MTSRIKKEHIEKVVFALYGNSRKTLRDIERETGLNRITVSRILSKLERDKTIWGYVPIVDNRVFDRKTFLILIKAKTGMANKVIRNKMEYAKRFVNEPGSDFIWMQSGFTHGRYDLYIHILAYDLASVKKFVNDIINLNDHDIEEVEILQELIPIRFNGKINPKLSQDVDENL